MGGHAVYAIGGGELSIWVSEGVPERPSVDALREHEIVVREALRTVTPLPLRFGTSFASEEEAVQVLVERGAEFTRALQGVEGQIEMGLRVEGELDSEGQGEVAPDVTTPGRAYLEQRRQAQDVRQGTQKRAREILERIDARFRDVVEKSSVSVEADRGRIGSVAHLVRTDRLRLYRNRVSDVRHEWPDFRLVASGPWAPYSFV